MLDTDATVKRCEREFQALQPLCLLSRSIRGRFSQNLVERDIVHLDVNRFLYLLQNYCFPVQLLFSRVTDSRK